MSDNEIKKALEWCEHFENNVVFKGNGDEKCVQALQMMVVIKHSLKEYNLQQEQIKKLENIEKYADKLIKKQEAEIERLQKLLDDKCDKCIARDRAEAIKEFVKEIINNILPKYLYGKEETALRIGFAISEKAKEITEGSK